MTSTTDHIVIVIQTSAAFTKYQNTYNIKTLTTTCVKPKLIQCNGRVTIFNRCLMTSYINQKIHHIKRNNGVLRRLFAGSIVIAWKSYTGQNSMMINTTKL